MVFKTLRVDESIQGMGRENLVRGGEGRQQHGEKQPEKKAEQEQPV